MHFAKLNGVTLHYQVIGAPEDKPLLVFSNSLGTDFRIWRDVIFRLAGDYALLTYDKRGHGLSDLGETPYTMDDHIGDLAALLDHLGQRNAVVVGLSVGGLIAQGLAHRRPDLVRALILCDTAHKIGTAESWADRIAGIEKGGIEALAEAILDRWFTPEFQKTQADAFAGYRNMLVRTPKDGYLGTCVAIRDTDFTEQTKALKVPTLCVVGHGDGSTPPDVVRGLSELIEGAEFQIIAQSGHLPCIEQPQVLAGLIVDFLQRARIR